MRGREADLERLMRSLSEEVNSQNQSQNPQVGHEVQQNFLQPSTVFPGQRDFSVSFSQSQPSFLLELLSMSSPAVGWNGCALPDPALYSAASREFKSSTGNTGFATSSIQAQSQQDGLWTSEPDYPPWFSQESVESRHVNMYVDRLQDLLSTPASWEQLQVVSSSPAFTIDMTMGAPTEKTSHSSGVTAVMHSPRASPGVMGSPSTSTPLNSAASTLPSTPNSSMSYGSFSDAAAEEGHSHHGIGGSISRPPSLQQPQPVAGPSGRSSTKRKTLDCGMEESCDEIQSHDAKKSCSKLRRKGLKRVREPRYAIQTPSDVEIMEDGYKWRKYGQKAVKNSPHPRSYYRCTHMMCPVRKRVERSAEDTGLVITTYEGTHTHVSPVTGSRGPSDEPLLFASGEHPPGGAPFHPPTSTSTSSFPLQDVALPAPSASVVKYEIPTTMDAATSSQHKSSQGGPLRPTPSINQVDPASLLGGPVPASGTAIPPLPDSLLRAQKLLDGGQDEAQPQLDGDTRFRSGYLMKDLGHLMQDVMCWGNTLPHHASRAQVIHPLLSTTPSSGCFSTEGLLEDIV